MVFQRSSGAKMEKNPACSALGVCRCRIHISDSGTPFHIHRVTRAGRIPTKNTARQFWLVTFSTIPATTTADAYPQAHELWTIAMAFDRRWVGQVSATRVAPVFHSPPMPRPSTKRNAPSIGIVVDSPEPSEQTE